jgi:hypothetical protein
VVLRNIGRPFVRGEKTPLTATAGAAWAGAGGALQLTTEALVAERVAESGYDAAYRAGMRISTRLAIPITAFVTTDVADDFTVDRWTFGLAVGGLRRGVLVATLPNAAEDNDLLSVHGVASNRGHLLDRR